MQTFTSLLILFLYLLVFLLFIHLYRSMKVSRLKKMYEEALRNLECGNYGRAIEIFNRMLMTGGDIKEVWLNKGVAFVKVGKYDEAILAFREALKIDEEYQEAWINLARALVESGRVDEAIDAYDRLMSLGDSEKWKMEKGVALYRAERYEEALETLSSLENPEAMIYSALCLSKLGRSEEAVEIYRKVLEKDPENSIALNNLATLLFRSEKYDEAVRILKEIHEKFPSTEIKRRLSEVLMITGNYGEARELFEELIKSAEEDSDVCYNAALCFFMSGEIDRAKELADRAIELNPYAGDAWLLRARIHEATGNERGAEYSVKRAIQLDEELRKIVEKDEKLRKYLN